MKQTNRKPLEFKPAQPGKPSAKARGFERQHKDFLGFVATGHSIGDAAALVGATRAAYGKKGQATLPAPALLPPA